MDKMTRWLVSKVIPNWNDTSDLSVRQKYAGLEGWVSIVINIFLFVIKLVIGLKSQSIALIADAVHSLSDSATSLVIIIGFKIAGKPADKEHPFGHGRMESVASLIVSVLLFVAGFELLVASIKSSFSSNGVIVQPWMLAVVLVTLIVKELLARFSKSLGKMINSSALIADGYHHSTDAWSTGIVLLGLFLSYFGLGGFDGLAGILVSGIIFYSAIQCAKEAIEPLLGQAPDPEVLRRIEASAMEEDGVMGVHDIICHYYGQATLISLHIEVSDTESAPNLHELSEKVEQKLSRTYGGKAVVHIDPINQNHPKYTLFHREISRVISLQGDISSFHELRIVGKKESECNVIFDIVLKRVLTSRQTNQLVDEVKRSLKKRFEATAFFIKVEPPYVYDVPSRPVIKTDKS